MVESLREHPERLSVVVVKDGRPVGIVRRESLFAMLTKPPHPEIYKKKPISTVMEPIAMLIDAQLRLEQVSRLVTQKSRVRLIEEFVIIKEGKYHGLGQTIDLLRQITEQQLQAAKHSNPLTLLPGNGAVRSCIDRLIEAERRFVVCHLDLDAFKPYNDVYGYAHGDQVILHLANVLQNVFSKRLDFVGHVGGDDFLVVARSADWTKRMCEVIQSFRAKLSEFYSPEHLQQGYLCAADRDGQIRNFPLLSVSVAALDSATMGAESAYAIAHQLAHLKKIAKAREGDNFIFRSGKRLLDLLQVPDTAPALPITRSLSG